jgi:thiamine pyrophosphate-dependent acetolactate synthase large subunit-like protein
MRLRDCFAFIAGQWRDEIVITSAGNASEMWWDITRDTERVFYLEASMSLASMFAAGIAHGIPAAKVWCFSGDGAFCMNPGMLMVERQMGLPNLKHFLVSNRTYGSTHDVALGNRADNDYQAIARGVGLANVHGFASLAELEAGFGRVAGADCHAFAVLEVEPIGKRMPSEARHRICVPVAVVVAAPH